MFRVVQTFGILLHRGDRTIFVWNPLDLVLINISIVSLAHFLVSLCWVREHLLVLNVSEGVF